MVIADIPTPWLNRARKIALALPEATEVETWDHPTFRVRNKIFLGMGAGTKGVDFVPQASDQEWERAVAETVTAERLTRMSMKATPGEQASLLAEGFPFFRPKYVGSKGWIGLVITEQTDWDEVRELVED